VCENFVLRVSFLKTSGSAAASTHAMRAVAAFS
jgi:hypothetical protein